MCGIAGFVDWPAGAVEDLRHMCDSIAHRGPDDEGLGGEASAFLGMRRLSIIDVAGGSQPIANEDGSVIVVLNGEIYNFREIRRRLESSGHHFRTHSDTEVLVHLYEERGEHLVDELRGMFAFALWDARRQRLLLARDRLGKKPLHYRTVEGGIAFGSELKCLVAAGLVEDTPDAKAVALFLALGYIPDPFSIYADVLKLPPAHTLTWDRDRGVRLRRYWHPPVEADPSIDERTATDEVRRLFTESVGYRLVSDVPVGAFLSGGIDSAAVVAEMVRQSDGPVDTYTIGFAEQSYNEAPAAAATARALGTRHHELIVEPDIDSLIDPVLGAFDEPFADSSALPTYLVSRLAGADIKVVLSGDGGDEVFGGYTRYADFARRNWPVPTPVRRVAGLAARRLPHGARGRGRLLELAGSSIERYTGMVAHRLAVADGGVANADLARLISWETLLDAPFAEAGRRDTEDQLLHVDLLTYLPGDILTKVDRMSMLCSLEARAPLLDHHLVEFAMRIPLALKRGPTGGKLVFRNAVRDLLPADVFQRPKSGFSLPVAEWLRTELRHRVAAAAAASSPIAQYVEPRAVDRVVREHDSGRRDHGALLWKLIALHAWHRSPRAACRVAA